MTPRFSTTPRCIATALAVALARGGWSRVSTDGSGTDSTTTQARVPAGVGAMGWLRRIGAGLAMLVLVVCASAHPMPDRPVWTDTGPGGVELTLQLPSNRLALAFGPPLAGRTGCWTATTTPSRATC